MKPINRRPFCHQAATGLAGLRAGAAAFTDSPRSLANAAYRASVRNLDFKPQSEKFENCEAANRLLKPEYRKEFRVPTSV